MGFPNKSSSHCLNDHLIKKVIVNLHKIVLIIILSNSQFYTSNGWVGPCLQLRIPLHLKENLSLGEQSLKIGLGDWSKAIFLPWGALDRSQWNYHANTTQLWVRCVLRGRICLYRILRTKRKPGSYEGRLIEFLCARLKPIRGVHLQN